MKKSFVELLNEIVNDFKQIHINIKNNKFKEIDVFSKISELLRLAEEVENYTPENISCLGNLFGIANIYFCYYNEEKSENLKQLEYYCYKWRNENYEDEFKLFLKNNSDNYDEMGYYIYDLDEYDIFLFEKQFSHILKNTSTVNKPPPPPKPPLKFIDLFKIPHNGPKKQKELKDLLKGNGYIDEDNKWEVTTCNKNELAFLYDLFEDKKILTPGSFAQKIKTFYKEFGLIVYNDKEPTTGGYCTLKNLRTTRVKNNDTYQNFEIIFSDWVK